MKGKASHVTIGEKRYGREQSLSPGPADYNPPEPDRGPRLTISKKLNTRPEIVGPG